VHVHVFEASQALRGCLTGGAGKLERRFVKQKFKASLEDVLSKELQSLPYRYRRDASIGKIRDPPKYNCVVVDNVYGTNGKKYRFI